MGKRKPEIDAARASALAAELHALSGKLKRRLRALASAGDLTPSQTSVLMHLDREGPTTVTALARSEGVRSQSMGATVAVLEAAGMVSGSPDPNGRAANHTVADASLPRIDPERPRGAARLVVSRHPDQADAAGTGAARGCDEPSQSPGRHLNKQAAPHGSAGT